MAVTGTIDRDVRERIREVLGGSPDVELAVLFGSSARGQRGPRSDLDIGVLLLGDPAELQTLEIALGRATRLQIDLVDLHRAPPLLQFEIARDGTLLFARRPHAWGDFRARAMIRWWDWAPTARLFHEQAAIMVRRDVAGAKVSRASAWLNDAAERFGSDPETFNADRERRDLALFYLFLAIQECIDLAAHWVADAGWLPADDAASTFDQLAERAVIPRDLADQLRGAVGLGNRIAHGYALVDYQRVHREAQVGTLALRQFLHIVADAVGL